MTNTTPYHELAADFARKRLTRLTDKQGWLLHAAIKRHFGEATLRGLTYADGAQVAMPDGRMLHLQRRPDGFWRFSIEAEASLF
jgi:hypothetical protein